MFRVLPAAILLGSMLVLSAGCSIGPEKFEVIMEVEGSGGSAGEVSYSLPREEEGGKALKDSLKNVPLPWKAARIPLAGEAVLRATPGKGGTVTCRLIVEGTKVAEVKGKTDEPVTCETAMHD